MVACPIPVPVPFPPTLPASSALQKGRERICCYYRHAFSRRTGSRGLKAGGEAAAGPDQTIELLRRARDGDRSAQDALFARITPPLQRWAHGRLPGWARGMVSTTDLVQEALVSTYRAIERHSGDDDFAVHAYLRTALKSRLVDELRKVQRRPDLLEMKATAGDDSASPLEEAIGSEAMARYEAALEALDPASREGVIARLELGLPFADIAPLIGKPSADAARMAVSRALVKLAEAMGHD